jgi:molecular chaperone DnaJ
MKYQEALDTFELKGEPSEDEIKKQYRALSKKYHPDVNKEAGSEDKFKKINEAYEKLKLGKEADKPPFNPFEGFGFGGGFSNFNVGKQHENISLSTTISFKESVLGVKKDISYKRELKCAACNGQGHTIIDNGCKECNGKGKTVKRQGNSVFIQMCGKCQGKSSAAKCNLCSSSGSVSSESKIAVTIPPGVFNSNVLRLQNMGHFMGSDFMDHYTDVYLKINVTSDKNLSLIDFDVHTSLDISLLEALKGCSKTVPTIFGDKEVKVPKASLNESVINLPGLGVPKVGKQIVKLKVSYPKQEDLDKIIALLEAKDNQAVKVN